MRVSLALMLCVPGCSVETSGLRLESDGAPRDAGAMRDASAPDGRTHDARVARDAIAQDARELDAGSDAGTPGELDTLRWELRCGSVPAGSPWLCETANRDDDDTIMRGAPGVTYSVTLRVRGVVEEKTIIGGTSAGRFHIGGDAREDDWTEAGLTISDPGSSYWLNGGRSGDDTCIGLDYSAIVSIRSGAVVRIWGATRNPYSNRNFDTSNEPIVIDGVPPAPAAFDGQFVQVDAIAIEPLP